MILLHFRMHRAGVDCFRARHPSRIPIKSHSAFRAITRLVALDAGTHRTEILRVCRRLYVARLVLVVFVRMRFMFRSGTATGMPLVRDRFVLREKFFPAVIGTEIKLLAIARRLERRFRLVHLHPANRVSLHNSVYDGAAENPRETYSRAVRACVGHFVTDELENVVSNAPLLIEEICHISLREREPFSIWTGSL